MDLVAMAMLDFLIKNGTVASGNGIGRGVRLNQISRAAAGAAAPFLIKCQLGQT
jgi:hypothetical protein